MDIEKSREIRLWVTRVGIPVMITGVIVLMNPEVRGYLKSLTNKKKKIEPIPENLLHPDRRYYK